MLPQEEPFDVAIVGYGPSGATLGHLLGMCGVSVLVLEREAAAYLLPRAVHFDDEVMRVFQTIGLGEAIAAKTRVNRGMRFVDQTGQLILEWPRPQEITRHGWHASYRFHQPDIERILHGEMSRYPNVTIRRRCEAFLVEDRGADVELRYEDMSNGRIHRVRAKYVVGCDGARSLMRRSIESGMEDHGFHERWLVVDLLLTKPKPELGDYSIQYCEPGRSMTYARQPGNRRRWEIRLLPDDDGSVMTSPARVWPMLARWVSPEDAEIERTAIYTFHSLVAERWRFGRLLIAGDAAHQSPPFMGQGMCAGIRDVANLAWKLADVLKGNDDGRLLDSYESERRPNVRSYVTTAVRLGGLINASNTEAALEAVPRSPDGGPRLESLISVLGPGLGAGPNAGRLFGQPRVQDGRLMDDVVGYAPVLVADAALVAGQQLPASLKVVTTQDAPAAGAELAHFGVRAALLRPDRYILGTANGQEALKQLLQLPSLTALVG